MANCKERCVIKLDEEPTNAYIVHCRRTEPEHINHEGTNSHLKMKVTW